MVAVFLRIPEGPFVSMRAATGYPSVAQAATDDARADHFQDCLVKNLKTPEQCVAGLSAGAEQHIDFQPETPSTTSSSPQ